jgi:ketosteroid isomerase-like protein
MLGHLNSSFASSCRNVALGLTLAVMLTQGSAQHPQHGGGFGKKHESRREIDQSEASWRTALLKGNAAAMEALLADDYMAITPSGTLQTKDQTLANLRSGRVHFTALDLSDRKVRFYGTTALVTSVAEVKGAGPEGDLSGRYRYTRVYVQDAHGSWKIVSFEANRIREPGEHR